MNENEIIYTDQQLDLVEKIKTWYQSAIHGNEKIYFTYTGVSGSGKTTVLKKVIKELKLPYQSVMGCAFIGKAVSLLSMQGIRAQTIHSLIYYLEDTKHTVVIDQEPKTIHTLEFKPKQQLDENYVLIIVDEASMVNDEIIKILLSYRVPIIFIGDMEQLPPIHGISSILQKPDYHLNTIMRQVEGDPIVQLSQYILNDRKIPFGEFKGVRGITRVISASEFDITPKEILENYDVVLTPYNKQRDQLTEAIRRFKYGDKASPGQLQLGDRVICKRNNWKKRVRTNLGYIYLTTGLVGTITEVHRDLEKPFKFVADFQGLDNEFKFQKLGIDKIYLGSTTTSRNDYKNLNNKRVMYNELFEYAYALTVHASQGSTYKRVLFYDVKRFMDKETTRKLRYTAITRASDEITIIEP